MAASAEQAPREGEQAPGTVARAGRVRVLVVGMSTTQACGVRDHASLLSGALARHDVDCSGHWLERRAPTLRGARAEVSAWTSELERRLASEPPDAVLVHYSVFAHSYRGIPVFVRPMMAALRRAGVPVIAFMHELAFPWGRGGARGASWAASQRVALAAVMRTATAVVVTVQERGQWLGSRRWLPRRPLAVAPVFSTLPAHRAQQREARAEPLVGIFGYTYGQDAVSLVLEALAVLTERGRPVRLILLGSPGRQSRVGELWAARAQALAVAPALSFSGEIDAQELSDALAGCELLLFADGPGPTSRKTTLAGALASGTAVVAVDGPSTWRELIDAEAVELVQRSPQALAAAVERLLADAERRATLSARAGAFADQSMGVERSASVVGELLERVVRT